MENTIGDNSKVTANIQGRKFRRENICFLSMKKNLDKLSLHFRDDFFLRTASHNTFHVLLLRRGVKTRTNSEPKKCLPDIFHHELSVS
jgi:hypothetical protein